MPPRRLLNTEQAAEILGVTPGRVRQWYVDNTLVPEPKVAGSRDRYVREDRVTRLKEERDRTQPRAGRPWPSVQKRAAEKAASMDAVLAATG